MFQFCSTFAISSLDPYLEIGMKEMDPPLWEPTCAEACRLLLTLEEQQ